MPTSNEFEDLEVIVPVINTDTKVRGCVVAITTSSARTNLAALLNGTRSGHVFDFTADGGNVYLFFNNADAGTIDETATGAGVTVAGRVIFNGQTVPLKFVNNYTWLVAKGSAACNLRVQLSSRGNGQNFGPAQGEL